MKPIELTREARAAAATRLQAWLKDELDQEVGGLQAEMLLDELAAELGPLFYNRGVADARAVVAGRAEDLDEALYGLERQTSLR
ncbi:DUF2164 domain-containing protein [Brevundimonas sp. BAL450]|uniref:DUF2164 domain-containing protein n=1 Tax=Brevundimonas abyssalis TAR-001 TaxID=1391729 RepID=A0A8E0KJC1_9CAUL|nr:MULTISPECIES: DUF2164 domain-containing protein [Brevundimonas]MBG7614979.1 DUF2164 domain-containing protein [Brevundimonas sp. BAL450]GAD57895.1 hypothetical protein MBEBAB_0145 [Brevundimonas abyssalis TAR-001]